MDDEDDEECFVCNRRIETEDYFTFDIVDGEPTLIEFCSEVCHYIYEIYKCRDIIFF